MADGLFYVDSKPPFNTSDFASVTTIATNKALILPANLHNLGGNYFNWVGKAVRMRIFGRYSAAATPGTQSVSLLWGTGADANGTVVAASGLWTPNASLSNNAFCWEMVIRCRATGSSGSLFASGYFHWLNVTTSGGTGNTVMVPPQSPAAVTVDLTTVGNVLSPQSLAVTSTTNVLQVHDYMLEALN